MTVLPLARDGRKPRRPSRAPLLPKLGGGHEGADAAGEGGFDGASFSGAVFNLSTTVVGAGIMALPAAVKVLGLVPGLAMIVLGALLTEASIDMILRAGRPPSGPRATSYAAVVGDAFGSAGRALLQTCVVVNNLGMLIVYMIIIGDVLSGTSPSDGGDHHTGVLEGWFGRHWWTARSFVLLATTLLVFAPLISFKRVDSLRYTSALSVALALVFVVVTAGIAVVKLMDGSAGLPRLLPEILNQASFWKLFTTVPILVTAYICQYSVHPIENELKDPSQMKSITRATMCLCSTVYVATSLFGFMLFGEETMDDVLANFDADLGFPTYGALLSGIVRVSYVLHLMLVFPIIFYSLRLNLDGLLFPLAIPLTYDGQRFAAITVGLMGAVFCGANFVPSIWDAFQFTGATAAVAIGFIFPAAVALRDVYEVMTRKDKVLACFMILLAVSSSTIAISSDIYGIFTNESGS
ncbi:amino acid transporter AVT6A-like [Phoenix dactylifera]|uniref:Amino acid transporter AVT6A-like n=1 Tax=Phoenix dactylifera TaxID=42345 RepID=A0A8B7C2N3_PHODC|nr:amino acid transporter AVT6A-like [Phoenix dactylifera]